MLITFQLTQNLDCISVTLFISLPLNWTKIFISGTLFIPLPLNQNLYFSHSVHYFAAEQKSLFQAPCSLFCRWSQIFLFQAPCSDPLASACSSPAGGPPSPTSWWSGCSSRCTWWGWPSSSSLCCRSWMWWREPCSPTASASSQLF